MGALVGAVNADDPLGGPLTFMGVVFVLLQVLTPLHLAVGYNLGDRTAAWLYDELTDACIEPPGHRPPRGSRSSATTSPWPASSTSA